MNVDEFTESCVVQSSELLVENMKLRSMCLAAAIEIEEHWKAHCNPEGYGPSSLVSRLKGKLPPSTYNITEENTDVP